MFEYDNGNRRRRNTRKMMKTPKAGQICNINGVLYRARKRTNGCHGCALDNFISCPNIQDSRKPNGPVLECELNNIILTKP